MKVPLSEARHAWAVPCGEDVAEGAARVVGSYLPSAKALATLYLAGPMTGLPEFNYPLFHRTAKAWREAGYHVLSPAENYGGDTSLTRAAYLRADMPMVLRANALIVLPGWEGSRGARHEVLTAQLMGRPIYDATTPGVLTPVDATVESAVTVPASVGDFAGAVDGGGVKGVMKTPKTCVELIDPYWLEGVGNVLLYGKRKYAANNWMRGMSWVTVVGGILRHLYAFLRREEVDAESGLPHLHHAACGLMFLSHYSLARREAYVTYDDRAFGTEPVPAPSPSTH